MDFEFRVLDATVMNKGEVVQVILDADELSIKVNSLELIKICKFESVVGYRVLDASDLLEFWCEINMQQGCVFQVFSGGWLEQESKRNGFVSAHHKPEVLNEFIVVGIGCCVNVLTTEVPHIATKVTRQKT